MKPNILSRYLIKEALSAMAAVTFLLLLLFISQQLVRLLGYVASGKLAANILFQLLGCEIPYLLSFLLPLGFYLGVIWAYGGLYSNNELRVMHGCGLSIKRLSKHVASLAIMVTTVVLILMLWVNPWVEKAKTQVISQGRAADNIIDTILPGRFQINREGNRIVYVERISRNHKQANNVFIADQKNNPDALSSNRWTVVSAARGYQKTDPTSQTRFLVAEEGNRYEGSPGESDYKVIQFQKYSVHVPEIQMNSSHSGEVETPTRLLWKGYQDVKNAAELQWRLAIPISVMLLALLAIPLCQVKPRQGRYLQLLIAIIIYVAYVNLLFVSRNWIEQKIVPISLGMWWVHLSFLLLIAWISMAQFGKNIFLLGRRLS